MNRLPPLIVFGLVLASCTSSPAPDPTATPSDTPTATAAGPGRITAGWSVTDGVETPESVYVDTASGSIFVSMIVGQPGDRDGNGRIMKLAPDGKIVSATWVIGLNAPKGLRSHNGMLWTADIDEVIGIDIAKGQIASRVTIDGAQFLNDVAVGEDGTVFVSDMLASRIYALKDGKIAIFAEGDAMEYPNGLLVEGDALIVAAWGKPEADFTTKVPGHLFSVNLATKQKTLIAPKPLGNLDAVESDGRGGYILTDFPKGQLIQVTKAGEAHVLGQHMAGTADLAFVPTGNIAIVPHMMENKITAYDLSATLK